MVFPNDADFIIWKPVWFSCRQVFRLSRGFPVKVFFADARFPRDRKIGGFPVIGSHLHGRSVKQGTLKTQLQVGEGCSARACHELYCSGDNVVV